MSDIVTEIVGAPAPAEEANETPATEAPVDQAPAEEADETPAQPAPEEDPQFSSRFAALSRKEKYLQEQQVALKAQQEQYDAVEALKAKGKENPQAILEHFGITLDDLILSSLGEDAPPATPESQIDLLRAEIAEFKAAEQKKAEDKEAEAQREYQSSIDEAVTSHQLEITNHLSQNVDKYELINLQGAQDLVWEVTEAHYDANGVVLTPEQASDKVEEYLEEQVRKAMNTKKFGTKPETQEKSSDPFIAEQDKPAEKPKSHTLTSEYVQQAAPSDKPSGLSVEESKNRAAALLKWN